MALSEAGLADFVERVREQRADSRRAVQLRVVEPLLERLGWDVRSPAVEPDAELGGERIDYALSVEGTTVVGVDAVAPDAALDDAASSLAITLADAGVGWGLLTDGRRYVLLALLDDGVRRRRIDLEDLPEHVDALAPFTREARVAAVGTAARRAAYSRLAEHRDAAVDAVTAALVDVAGEAIEDDARESATRLVDHLVERAPDDVSSAADDESAASAGTPVDRRAGASAGGASADEASADGLPDDASGSADSTSESSDRARDEGRRAGDAAAPDDSNVSTNESSSGDGTAGSRPDGAASDGEYVVRFFGGNSSVGAVGTNSPGGTLAGAVDYLYENHGLGRAVTLPWGVEDGAALLTSEPEHPSGAPMEPREQVHDCYVWTGASAERTRAAIEDLADAVGLRVMFQGDW